MFTIKNTVLGVLLVVASFSYGLVHGDSARTEAMQLVPTDAERVEMMQRTIDRQAVRLKAQDLEIGNNIKVIPMEYDDCIDEFMAFYKNFPNYHYESEDGSVTFDYVVPNPIEEANQYCDFIIEDYASKQAVK